MKTNRFRQDSQLLWTVTLEKLRVAQAEEEAKKPISDPAIEVLRKHVHGMFGRVMGSDESRYQTRSQIWSTTMCKGPPTLWMTINPSDLNDPIAQIFVGENIDLDSVLNGLSPDAHQRAQNIASDPYGAEEFLHFMINTILETLFQVKVSKYKVTSKKGVWGVVDAYFGMKEVQGRGTIHLNLLLWLEDTPSPNQLLYLLRQDSFRDKIKAYFAANIRAYLPGMEDADTIKQNAGTRDVAYTRPPHPNSTQYDDDVRRLETRLACVEQVHTCKLRRCLVLDKTGQYHCKR